ncbi:MAG: class I SAM-dependent methyltransferase [candidate division Zixibacteria bacterium]|nr:class I SAM-dependent methyltransferase [candidate division Zixibacteria bacterium]
MTRKTPRDSEDRAVLNSLESTYCPDVIKQAREKQDEMLVRRFRGHAYAIADIGCGTGYHGSIFAPTCRLYHGFEISPEIAEIARVRWAKEGLSNTALFVGDVADATPASAFYDLVFCLYFTPGNIRDKSGDMARYTDAYLDQNPRFVTVFSRFYRALKTGGTLLLTIYKDTPEAEAAQIDFYEHTGQQVITPPGLRFVATREGFWSARWTRRSLLSNLNACGIAEPDICFHDLNAIAWLIEIGK